jgi:protein-L-isoaspartate O-methyltransferase
VIEFFRLLGVAVENRRYLRALKSKERQMLGDRSWYRAIERAQGQAYRWSGPFALSKRAKRKLKLPREDLVYGETPILTAWQILNDLGVDQADHVVELGGGRGTFSLVAVSAFGCAATMLEVVPAFVSRTRRVAARLGLERLTVKQGDILSQPLQEGTVYFITATTFCDASWRTLDQKLATAPDGARAVSLSVPLNRAYWKIDRQTSLPFSWGDNTVYFQTRLPRGEGPPSA